ncbi:hypothetical protein EON65_35050 [archaeon]|nr:MAG: hypothetical protein EON65_35050 [archaeon]
MLSRIRSLFSSKGDEVDGESVKLAAKAKKSAQQAATAAKVKAKKTKKDILKRQKQLEKEEVVQEWCIAVGKEIPKKKKDCFLVKNITRRNVWMEDLFIFNQIKAQFPDEIFHPPSQYVLKWQPVGSYFQTIVKLDDPALQENAVMEMNKMNKVQQKKMLFLFTTLDPAANMFAPKVHPSSLVSYRTKNEVLKKLSEYFLQGKISVDDIEQILLCSPDVWSNSLYNYLPEDEQVYHQYLNEKIVHEDPNKSIAKKFLDEEITLKEYEDLRFPERKAKADRDNMFYPLLFEGTDCIICGEEKSGVVKCHTCDNMVCKACIRTVFHGVTSKSEKIRSANAIKSKQSNVVMTSEEADKPQRQSFLLLHHRYCMRLGALPEVQLEVIPEPGYLREFRKTTRVEILKRFNPDRYFEDDILLAEYDEEEIEQKRLQALKLQLQEEEEKRILALQNPAELQEKRKLYEEKKRRLDKIKKDLLEAAAKAADTSRAEQYVARNKRIKNELLDKIEKQLYPSILELHRQVGVMSLPGEFLPSLLRDVHGLMKSAEEVLGSVQRDEDGET